MALSTEEAAFNTAVTAAVTALEALIAARLSSDGAGFQIHFTPVDTGDSAFGDNSHSNNDTAVGTTLTQRVAYEVRGDGEFPIQIVAGHDGSLVPLFWYVTNQAGDLS